MGSTSTRGRVARAVTALGAATVVLCTQLTGIGPATALDADTTVTATRGGTVAVAAGRTGQPDKPCPNAGKPAEAAGLGPSVPAGQVAVGMQDGDAPGHCRFLHTALLALELPATPAGATLTGAALRMTLTSVAGPTDLSVFATSTDVPARLVLSDRAPAVESPASGGTVTGPGPVSIDALPAVEAVLRGEATALAVAGGPPRALLAAPGTAGAPALVLTYGRSEPDDTTPPTVSITSPSFGETVFGQVPVRADARDDVRVASVTATIGGRLVGTDDTAPFEMVVDTALLPDGEHPLAVEAVDGAGNSTRDLLPVVIDNSGGPLHRLDLDLAAGRIDVDTYVLQGLRAVLLQPGLDRRYVGTLPEEVSAWTWVLLQRLPDTSAAVRAQAEQLLTPVDVPTARASTDPTARTTTPNATAAAADEELTGVGCGRLRAFLNLGYDCSGTVGSVVLRWSSEDYDEPVGTVPARVSTAATAMANAQEHFAELGYRPIGATEAFMAEGIVERRAISLPNGTVVLNRDDADLAATAGHELFHQYEYEYLQVLDLRTPGRLSDIGWLLEASAEWASHQLVAEYPEDYTAEDEEEYLRNVELLLNDPQRDLLSWDASTNRQYGAFAVLEWLHSVEGADVVRSIWDTVDDTGDARTALGEALGARSDLMWQDLYHLDLDIPGRISRTDTDAWRDELASTVGREPYADLDRNRPVEQTLALGSGDSALPRVALGPGAATFLELDLDDDQRSLVTVTRTATDGELDVALQALTAYDLDPAAGPAQCAATDWTGDTATVLYDPAVCEGVSLVVSNPDLREDATGTVSVQVGDRVDTTLTNGLIRLGVHAEGHLDVPGYDASSGTGTTTVGLRWLPTNADALAPGCACEGWGVADLEQGLAGWANESTGGVQDLSLLDADFDTSTGTSVVGAGAGAPFEVRHEFRIAPESANLFEVDVTITNTTTSLGGLLGVYEYGPLTPRYRRVMDWDVEPTAFSEFVTIGARGGQLPPEVVTATNDGFASADPRRPATDLGARGLFTDFGPDDHGALFDLELDEIDPGESVSFTLYYGAGATTAMVESALDLVGADAWSIAEPDVADGARTGAPNAFVFGLRFDRPVLAARSLPQPPRALEPPRRDGAVRQR